MAQVVLPYGYPILQGAEAQSVVYQGTMARMYVVPHDPRTDSQLFERKLLSDISKMRGISGLLARGLWKIAFGKKWASVIYQMARGDVDGLWSARREEWEGFTTETKAYLSGEAPFQVTYNDPGMIWWCLYGMLYDWGIANDLTWWQMPVPDETAQDYMFEWWRGLESIWDDFGVLVPSDFYEEDNFSHDGDWEIVADGVASGGYVLSTDVNNSRCWFVTTGKYVRLYYRHGAPGWSLYIEIDGQEQYEYVNQYSGSGEYLIGPLTKGFHLLRFRFHNGGDSGNAGNVDRVFVVSKKSEL